MLKLSKLQRWILRAALDLYLKDDGDAIQPWQIKEEYFRLPCESRGTGLWWFSKTRTPGYNAASASTSRAAKRLAQRGLVIVRREGLRNVEIAPTRVGYAVAAAIERQTPGAFGFKPIKRSQLDLIVSKSRQDLRKSPGELASEAELKTFLGFDAFDAFTED